MVFTKGTARLVFTNGTTEQIASWLPKRRLAAFENFPRVTRLLPGSPILDRLLLAVSAGGGGRTQQGGGRAAARLQHKIEAAVWGTGAARGIWDGGLQTTARAAAGGGHGTLTAGAAAALSEGGWFGRRAVENESEESWARAHARAGGRSALVAGGAREWWSAPTRGAREGR